MNSIGLTMPRPKRTDRPREVMINLPESLLTRLDLYFFDPKTGKPKYGSRSRLIERLLREWLDRQEAKNEL